VDSQFYNLKEFRTEFNSFVKTHTQRIVITSHVSPDDDAIASVLATFYYINNYLEISEDRIKIIISGPKEPRWSYFKNFEKIEFVEDIYKSLVADDLIIVLDTKELDRITNFPEKIQGLRLKSICIDHHKSDLKEGTTYYKILSYPEITYTSNAEALYWLFFHSFRTKLSKEICEILLLGIYGDTGSFTYITGKGGTSSFIAAKNLIEAGNIEVESLKSEYSKLKLGSLKVLGILLKNLAEQKIEGWPPFVVSFIEKTESNKFTDEEYSNGVGIFKRYLNTIEDLDWGFYLRYNRQEKAWGISFRAKKGSVNVREIAEHFGGGGHDQAAGGKLEAIKSKKSDFYVEQILEYLKNNKPTLTK